jgi:F-type H+-transporting ATPase subunit b
VRCSGLDLAAVLIPPAIAIGATDAWAASGAAHHSGPPTAGQWLLMVFTFINFGLFVYLFRRFTREPLRDFFKSRHKELVDLMASTAREKQEAQRLRKECEDKIAALDRIRADLIADVQRMAQLERQKSLAAAREAAERMKHDAERTAATDLQRAIAELREEAVRLATAMATEDLRRRLDAKDRERLLEEFLGGISRT